MIHWQDFSALEMKTKKSHIFASAASLTPKLAPEINIFNGNKEDVKEATRFNTSEVNA